MTRESAALLDSINPAASEVFVRHGFEVVEFPKSVQPDELTELAQNNKALGIRSGPPLQEGVFANAERLETVGLYCVGTNHVDLNAASGRGIAVFNSLHENTRSVAEHVIGATFDLMKRTSEHNRSLHEEGSWSKTDERTYEVRGKTLGIVGYGAVGSQVSVMAEGIGMSVKYFDPSPKMPPYGKAERVASLDDLLSESDVITLHVPGGASTRNLIDREALAQMKPGAYIINTARGDVVDYEAALAALGTGQLGGIAVDVYQDEPKNRGDRFDHILRGAPNALLTPHTAGSTVEAQADIGEKTSLKLLGYLATGSTVGSVNMPELALGTVPEGQTRVLHVHDDVPGVEADLLSRIAANQLNIVANSLRTYRSIGYAAVDVEGNIPEILENEIAATEHTIRARIIK